MTMTPDTPREPAPIPDEPTGTCMFLTTPHAQGDHGPDAPLRLKPCHWEALDAEPPKCASCKGRIMTLMPDEPTLGDGLPASAVRTDTCPTCNNERRYDASIDRWVHTITGKVGC